VFCFFFESFLILRVRRNVIINKHRSSCKVPVMIVKFEWKLNFLNRFLKDSSGIKLHENPFIGSRIVSCGQTDGRTHRQT
jgi:hypothetical protein